MDAIELLTTRCSNGKLTEPAPDDETIDLAMQAALRAPDHGALRPWRLQIVRGDARAKLGEVFAEALLRREPGAAAEALDKARSRPMRAPLIIIVSARCCDHAKIPEVEQLLSAGAAAQNVMLALHARGFAGIWRTGQLAYDPHVRTSLGLDSGDHIVGFIYAGSAARPAPEMRRPGTATHVEHWG